MQLGENKMKANNLTVESFRGVNDEISLDLEDFTIIYGENGMGKSSFVNSIEYLFVQKLAFLSRSTIKKSAYVNKNSGKSDVKIELNLDDDEYISLVGTRKYYSDGFDEILENPYIKNASFVINRDRLLKFIEGTQTDRYKAIMELLGVKKLDKIQGVLSPSIKALKQEFDYKIESYESDLFNLEELSNSRNEALTSISNIKESNDLILKSIEDSKVQNMQDKEKLSKLMNDKDDEYTKFIDEINELLKLKNLELIDMQTDIEEYKRKLYSANVFKLDDKLEDFNKAYVNLDLDIENDLKNVLDEYENIASDNLKSSTYLIKTLDTSRDYLKFTNSSNCPICNNDIDSESIINEINDRISQINSSNDALKSWKNNLKLLNSSIDNKIKDFEKFNDIITEINELSNKNIETVDLTILFDLKEYLDEFSEFKIHPTDFNDLNINELSDNAKLTRIKVDNTEFDEDKSDYIKIGDKLTEFNIFKESNIDVKALEDQIKQRENEIEIKSREIKLRENESENLEKQISQFEIEIEKLQNEIDNFDEKIEKVENQLKRAEKTFEIFTDTKQEYIDNMLSEIRDDIEYFYDYIHDDEEISRPDMVVSGAKKIDVKLDSFGEYVDSRSFASEGHLDTLGLCIFLALNKQFNNLNLIVLDDVLTTVDVEHKEKIAKLLIEEFEDYQFILTAHNKEWVDQLEELCIDYGRDNVVYEIEDWSLEDGPIISQR